MKPKTKITMKIEMRMMLRLGLRLRLQMSSPMRMRMQVDMKEYDGLGNYLDGFGCASAPCLASPLRISCCVPRASGCGPWPDLSLAGLRSGSVFGI